MRLLLVEDDSKLARAVQRGLTHEGYLVDMVATGQDALERGSTGDYDAILLDVMLPGLDGFEVCERLRRLGSTTPILMLTARSDVTDRIRGLDGGADDYVVKPFDFGELLARIRVLVRRGPVARSQLLLGNLRVDESTRVVTRGGSQIELTSREFDVLLALARRPGLPMSRSALLAEVWQGDVEVSPNIVDVYIGYLRKKLEGPRGRRVIRTVRGKGFMLEA